MPDALRPLRWQVFEKFLLEQGCTFSRQTGSHRVYKKPDLLRPIIVPAHTYPISVSVILNNLRTLGVSRDELIEFLAKK